MAVTEFYADRSKSNGRRSICGACDRAKGKAYYEAHADKALARSLERYRWLTADRPPRICAHCKVNPSTSSRHWFCDACRELGARRSRKGRTPAQLEREKRRGSSSARGYGNAHQKLRKQVARQVAAGNAYCARCGKWIDPDEPWDLGHDDDDRSRYSGPEHRACNRATASHRRVRRARWSREW